jgi:hypothetical protein
MVGHPKGMLAVVPVTPERIHHTCLRHIHILTQTHANGPLACHSHETMCDLVSGPPYVLMRQEFRVPLPESQPDTLESVGETLAHKILRMAENEHPYYDWSIYSFHVSEANVTRGETKTYVASLYIRTDSKRIREMVHDMDATEDQGEEGGCVGM